MNDAPILDQMREHWQKVAAVLLWKLVGQGTTVTITAADLETIANGPPLTIFTHGHYDSFDFKLVTEEEAQRLIAHAETMKGRA